MQRHAQPAAAHRGGAGVEHREQGWRRLATNGLAQFEVAPSGCIHAHERVVVLDFDRLNVG